jgi:hypothetical protein
MLLPRHWLLVPLVLPTWPPLANFCKLLKWSLFHVLQCHRHIDISTYRHIDISTYWHINISTYRHIDISTYRHIDISTYRIDISDRHIGLTYRIDISDRHIGSTYRIDISDRHIGSTYRINISGVFKVGYDRIESLIINAPWYDIPSFTFCNLGMKFHYQVKTWESILSYPFCQRYFQMESDV